MIEHQRTGVHPSADQPLHRLELVDAAEHEMRLDALRDKAFEMFGNERWGCLGDHLAVSIEIFRLLQTGSRDVILRHQLREAHLIRIDDDRHLVGLGSEFGEHMAGVDPRPLGGLSLALRRE